MNIHEYIQGEYYIYDFAMKSNYIIPFKRVFNKMYVVYYSKHRRTIQVNDLLEKLFLLPLRQKK